MTYLNKMKLIQTNYGQTNWRGLMVGWNNRASLSLGGVLTCLTSPHEACQFSRLLAEFFFSLWILTHWKIEVICNHFALQLRPTVLLLSKMTSWNVFTLYPYRHACVLSSQNPSPSLPLDSVVIYRRDWGLPVLGTWWFFLHWTTSEWGRRRLFAVGRAILLSTCFDQDRSS